MDALIWPPAGRYILAVSGGVDSMSLLDVMAHADRGYELVVAHYDHGMRADSHLDRELVEAAAARYKLLFVTATGALGQASEAVARAKRYDFLERVRLDHRASHIVTAHHQDDLIETSLLNLSRGTGRRGLAPLGSSSILRPMLGVSRRQIETYASQHQLEWHEDSTNEDRANPRNFLRHELLPAAPAGWSQRYLEVVREVGELNQSIDARLMPLVSDEAGRYCIDRSLTRNLTLDELAEVIIWAARHLDVAVEMDRRLVSEVALFIKSGRTGRHRPLAHGIVVELRRDEVRIYSAKNGLI